MEYLINEMHRLEKILDGLISNKEFFKVVDKKKMELFDKYVCWQDDAIKYYETYNDFLKKYISERGGNYKK